MRFDGKKPIEFTDETVALEQSNLEETKYVLKGSAPSTDSSVAPTEEPMDDFGGDEAPMDDLEGLEDAPSDDKPFDDEPFDAGVEADEDTDPAKYIQQLSGKLGQSLRQYTEDEGQPDFDLEKFAVNSVLSATHTSEMDKGDQRDIINKVKSAGKDNGDDVDGSVDGADDGSEMGGEEEVIDFGEEPVEEHHDMSYNNHGKYDRDEYILKGKDIDESKYENGTMIKNLKNMKTDAEKILSMDKDDRNSKLKGMDWADDHISTSADDAEEVADFLTTEGNSPCWDGYERVPNTKEGEKGSCRKKTYKSIQEAEYQGKNVELNKPMKGDVKKFKVYVKNDNGNVVKVNFGDKNMEIRRDNPEARKSFRARHKCDQKKDKTSAGYWSCKMWSSKSVSDILQESKLNRIFVDEEKLVKDLRLMENAEPMIEPQVVPKTPVVKPNKPQREVDRPFSPKRRTGVQPDPKAKYNDTIIDNE